MPRKRGSKTASRPAEQAVESAAPGGEQMLWPILTAPDMVCLCEDGKIIYMNAIGVRLLGQRSEVSMAGLEFLEFVHPDYREMITRLLNDPPPDGEPVPVKLQPRNGRVFETGLTIIAAGKKGNVVIQGHGVSGHADTAADSVGQDRYRYLVEHARDLICMCNAGVITFMNAAGTNMLAFRDPSQAVGRTLADLIHPDYRDIVSSELASITGEGTAVPVKFVRTDGTVIDAEIAVMPFGGGEGVYMIEARDITERIHSARRLQEREQHLHGIMETVADGIITMDENGIVQSFNPALEKMFGYDAQEVVGRNITMLMPEPDSRNHDKYVRRYLTSGECRILGVERQVIAQRKDGTFLPIQLTVQEAWHGARRTFMGIVRDVTKARRAEEELRKIHDELEHRVEERTRELTQEVSERRRAEEKLQLAARVIDDLSEAVIIVDADFNVTDVNPAFTKMTGYGHDEVIGQTPPFYNALRKDPILYAKMWRSIKSAGRWEGEFWSTRKSGEAYAERLSISAITDELGKAHKYAAVISDVTRQKQDEERIRYQANYDSLTGLPNRALFLDRLIQALSSMSRSRQKLGLMFIDLDGFKLVNDTMGHDVGDLLLKETAGRLGECVRSGDTVARFGGDEFTIIMPNLSDPRHAPIVAERVLAALAEPFQLKGHESFVSASIGIAVFPDDASDAHDLLKNADAAMYRAKEQGKASYHFFTSALNDEAKARLAMKNGLSKALERNEFSLHYQPKLEIETGRITGVEALMRWHNDILGDVSPTNFIPILEETGLVVEVGRWAIMTACMQHKALRETGIEPIPVAVNLSARQLREASFVPIVKEVLQEAGVDPKYLELEITESMLMSDYEGAVVALGKLHDLGITIAMDDFGTGYSSLSYLKRFPIDTIKIDRSFVSDIATSRDDSEIIKTIISMGQTLNRKVVAEGVETQEQLSILREYKCDEIQGYLFSRPLPADKLIEFFKQQFLQYV